MFDRKPEDVLGEVERTTVLRRLPVRLFVNAYKQSIFGWIFEKMEANVISLPNSKWAYRVNVRFVKINQYKALYNSAGQRVAVFRLYRPMSWKMAILMLWTLMFSRRGWEGKRS